MKTEKQISDEFTNLRELLKCKVDSFGNPIDSKCIHAMIHTMLWMRNDGYASPSKCKYRAIDQEFESTY
jgi:hypothetical protein